MSSRRLLVVMAKAPRPGHAKTRLLRRLAPDQTVELQRCFLGDTLTMAGRLRGVSVAVMCPPGDCDELASLVCDGVQVVAQTGSGLAGGLTSAFRDFESRFNRILAYNSDSPHLPAALLDMAFQALDTHDTVVGPTEDGGYYLIGATREHPGLFDGDRLGTQNALEALLGRLRAQSLEPAVLPVWYDVDVPEDLDRLETELQRDPRRAPRTAALLARWARETTT